MSVSWLKLNVGSKLPPVGNNTMTPWPSSECLVTFPPKVGHLLLLSFVHFIKFDTWYMRNLNLGSQDRWFLSLQNWCLGIRWKNQIHRVSHTWQFHMSFIVKKNTCFAQEALLQSNYILGCISILISIHLNSYFILVSLIMYYQTFPIMVFWYDGNNWKMGSIPWNAILQGTSPFPTFGNGQLFTNMRLYLSLPEGSSKHGEKEGWQWP